ncbi:hypothetical protein BGZ47_010468, partial [Haplosporangium gracile]
MESISPRSASPSPQQPSNPDPKLSFAAVTKATIRSAWSNLRAQTESRECLAQEQPERVWFTQHTNGHIAAIPYNPKTHLIDNVALTIANTFPHASCISVATPGVVLVCFDKPEELSAVVGSSMECQPSPLPILPTVYSCGSRIKIRAEETPVSTKDCKELANNVFGSFGKVILVKKHYVAGTTVRLSSFDFILEIPHSASKDLLIPRVAAVDSVNVLFSWSGSKFCYRCGEESHSKIQCPKPLDFNLALTPALEEPMMARAFPDPAAPLRETTKKAPPTKPKSAPNKNSASSESEWIEVGRGKNKKRGRGASKGDGVSSSSESDSPGPSPKKPAPTPKG